jgi:rare lipoprotein A
VTPHELPRRRVLPPRFVLFLAVIFLSGCASRNPVAKRQPPPTLPAPAPPETSEDAKRSTDAGPEPPSAHPPAPKPPAKPGKPGASLRPGYMEEGNASWYGNPFHGRRASNGEVYDMHKLTAAHRTLPFDTMVRVTNLSNGKSTVVRITDRGPFVDSRIIDLSLAAARQIESVGPGIVPVRLEVLSAIDPTAGFFTVQIGAFRDRINAEHLRDRLSASYSPIFIQQFGTPEGLYYRVRVGKVSGEEQAQQFGQKLHDREGFKALVIRLDEGASAGENK